MESTHYLRHPLIFQFPITSCFLKGWLKALQTDTARMRLFCGGCYSDYDGEGLHRIPHEVIKGQTGVGHCTYKVCDCWDWAPSPTTPLGKLLGKPWRNDVSPALRLKKEWKLVLFTVAPSTLRQLCTPTSALNRVRLFLQSCMLGHQVGSRITFFLSFFFFFLSCQGRFLKVTREGLWCRNIYDKIRKGDETYYSL